MVIEISGVRLMLGRGRGRNRVIGVNPAVFGAVFDFPSQSQQKTNHLIFLKAAY